MTIKIDIRQGLFKWNTGAGYGHLSVTRSSVLKVKREKQTVPKAEQATLTNLEVLPLLSCFTRTCRFTARGATLCQQMDQITSYQTLQLHSDQLRPCGNKAFACAQWKHEWFQKWMDTSPICYLITIRLPSLLPFCSLFYISNK